MRSRGFTLIELMVVVVVLGLLAAVAYQSLSKNAQKSRTSEARTNVGTLFNGLMAEMQTFPRCDSGVVGPVPELAVKCSAGPGGRCNPSRQPGGPGEYDISLWSSFPGAFGLEQPHFFHYAVAREKVGINGCKFTAQAFGDLDDDGVYSTFERAGAASPDGVTAAPGLFIDKEVE